MPVIAIVGSGPGLGLEIARAFGQRGFTVALISRDADALAGLSARLQEEGVEAAGYPADVTRPATVVGALDQIERSHGQIDVLEYSPADPTLEAVGVLEVAPQNLEPQLNFYLRGSLAAARRVVPGMVRAGSGTIFVTTGGGSINPVPSLANLNMAAAALRSWTLNLHQELAPTGVYVAHVAISAFIGAGHPMAEAAVIAQRYLDLYVSRSVPELHHIALQEHVARQRR